jgi:hypothetical protein
LWARSGTRPAILASRRTSAALSSASLMTAATARVMTVLPSPVSRAMIPPPSPSPELRCSCSWVDC